MERPPSLTLINAAPAAMSNPAISPIPPPTVSMVQPQPVTPAAPSSLQIQPTSTPNTSTVAFNSNLPPDNSNSATNIGGGQQQQSRRNNPGNNDGLRGVGKIIQRAQDVSKEFVNSQQRKLSQMTSGRSTPNMAQVGVAGNNNNNNNNNIGNPNQSVPLGRNRSNHGAAPSAFNQTATQQPSQQFLPPHNQRQQQQQQNQQNQQHHSRFGGGGGKHHKLPQSFSQHFGVQQQQQQQNTSPNANKGDGVQNINPPGKSHHIMRPPSHHPPHPPAPQAHYPATEDARYRIMLILAVFLGGWLLGSVIVAIHVSSFESDALVEIYARRLHYKEFPFNGSIDEVDAGARRQVMSGGGRDIIDNPSKETTTATSAPSNSTGTNSVDPTKIDNSHHLAVLNAADARFDDADNDDDDDDDDIERFDLKTKKKRRWFRRKRKDQNNVKENSRVKREAAAAAAFDDGDWEGINDKVAQRKIKPVTALETNEQFNVAAKKRKKRWWHRKRKNPNGAVVHNAEGQQFDDDEDENDVQYSRQRDLGRRSGKRHKKINSVEGDNVLKQFDDADDDQEEEKEPNERFDVANVKKKKRWWHRKRKNPNGAVVHNAEGQQFDDADDDQKEEEEPNERFDVANVKKKKRWWHRRRKHDKRPETGATGFDHDGDDGSEDSPEVTFDRAVKARKRRWWHRRRKERKPTSADDNKNNTSGTDPAKLATEGASPATAFNRAPVHHHHPHAHSSPKKSKHHRFGRRPKNGNLVSHEKDVAEEFDYGENNNSPHKKPHRNPPRMHRRSHHLETFEGAAQFDDPPVHVHTHKKPYRKPHRVHRRPHHLKASAVATQFDDDDDDDTAGNDDVKFDVRTKSRRKGRYRGHHDSERNAPAVIKSAENLGDKPESLAVESKPIERIKRSAKVLDAQEQRRPVVVVHKRKQKKPAIVEIQQGRADFDTKITFTVSNPDDEQRILEQVGVLAKQAPPTTTTNNDQDRNTVVSRHREEEETRRRRENDKTQEDTRETRVVSEERRSSADKDEDDVEKSDERHGNTGDSEHGDEEKRDRGADNQEAPDKDEHSSSKSDSTGTNTDDRNNVNTAEETREQHKTDVATELIETIASSAKATGDSNYRQESNRNKKKTRFPVPLERSINASPFAAGDNTLNNNKILSQQTATNIMTPDIVEQRAQRVCHAKLRGECRAALERVNVAIEELASEAGGIASVEFNTSIREVLEQIRRALKYPFALALSLNSLLLVFALFFLFSHHLAEGIVQNWLMNSPAAHLTPSRLALRSLGFGGGNSKRNNSTNGNNKTGAPRSNGKPPPPPPPPPVGVGGLNGNPSGGYFKNMYKNLQNRRSTTTAAKGSYQAVPSNEQQAMKTEMQKFNNASRQMENDGDVTTTDDESAINITDANDKTGANDFPASTAIPATNYAGAMTKNNSRVPLAQMTGEPSSGAQFGAPTLTTY